jgi:hypothetical protein
MAPRLGPSLFMPTKDFGSADAPITSTSPVCQDFQGI